MIRARMCHLLANQPRDILPTDFTLLERSSSGLENVLVITDNLWQCSSPRGILSTKFHAKFYEL